MNLIELLHPELLSALTTLVALVALSSAVAAARLSTRSRRDLDAALAELRRLAECLDGERAKVERLRDQLTHLRGSVEPLQRAYAGPVRGPVALAGGRPAGPSVDAMSSSPVELARAGAGVDALMKQFGLSRAEAELVYAVHGVQAGRSAA